MPTSAGSATKASPRGIGMSARPIDPHHFGAQVGQHHAAVRRGADAAKLDDPHAAQRPAHDSLRSSSPRLRPMISFMISEVPAKILMTRASV